MSLSKNGVTSFLEEKKNELTPFFIRVLIAAVAIVLRVARKRKGVGTRRSCRVGNSHWTLVV
jgi:hypothetical protein